MTAPDARMDTDSSGERSFRFSELAFPEPDLGANRRRRASKFVFWIALTIAANSGSWMAIYLHGGLIVNAASQVPAVGGAVAVLALSRRGRVRTAAHLLFWLAFALVWSIVVLFDGPDGPVPRIAHLWFVVLVVGLYFLHVDAPEWVRNLYAASCAASFLVVALAPGVIPTLHPAPIAIRQWANPLTLVAVMGTIVFFVRLFVADIAESEKRLGRANSRLETLVDNVLPRPIAERLRREGRTFADSLPAVSVLFADVVGFTALAAHLPAEEVVARLDALFSRLDQLAESHGLEKIKTIGDAYMVAAGVLAPDPGHARAIARFALAAQRELTRADGFHLRIGINSGPVVAGVIGRGRLVYDLWGDTVNIAQRMEQHGLPDRIQITRATRDLLADEFRVEPRGTIVVKGEREVEAFLLVGVAGDWA